VLLVDDEPQILRALRITLQARHFDVDTAADGAQALSAAAARHPDLIILDLGLPDIDGIEVIRRLRAWTTIPIVILSGRMNSQSKIEALDAGADDYVTKPFSIEELLARIRAVGRRVTTAEPLADVTFGPYLIQLADRRIRRVDGVQDEPVHLTPKEWNVLELLVRHPGGLISHRQLLQEVWGPTFIAQSHYLRQFMKSLRTKLEADPTRPRHLITEPGMGYRFQP
jgi:two-component system KDP operon response regulator KdpE